MSSAVKVLYVVGWKRSGSTILGNVLGEMSGFWHAGELRTIWGHGLLHGRLCGCGQPVAGCEFWTGVLREVDYPGVEEVYAWQREAIRARNLRTLLQSAPARKGSALDSYSGVAASLYHSIARATGARVIVDSSKQPADAALLGRLKGIEPYFLHLVRDPRAVAYSWQRRKASPGEGRRQEMMQVSPVRSTASWLFVNGAADFIRRRHNRQRSLLVRYEDFARDPRPTIGAVARLVYEPDASWPEMVGTAVRLSGNHTAGGNPGRFDGGLVELRPDDEWIERQPARHRRAATAMALPLLRRYGYPIRAATRTNPRQEGEEIVRTKGIGLDDAT
jgi:hypothetical protein